MALKLNNSNGEKVKDPYKNKEKFEAWLKNNNLKANKKNQDLIIAYVNDMANGLNIGKGTKKGSRSFTHLNTLRVRMDKIALLFEEHYKKILSQLNENEVTELFNQMRNGKIKKTNGKPYKSTADYVKIFKAFWNWHTKVMKKEGKVIEDITNDLDTTYDKKPAFVYFTIDDLKKLCDYAKFDYKVLMWFMFDTGIRSPTELLNVKVKDIIEKEGKYELNIREETSKTFGRKIKLMLCGDLVRKWIKEKNLKDDDFLFEITPFRINEYLKRLAKRIFGDKVTLGRNKFSDLTMYDFRHSSCCYWLPRYKNESALKYRFGWKEARMIHYYSELLGMKDTIAEEDLLVDTEAKTLLQKELEQEKKQREILEENVKNLQEQINKITRVILEQAKKKIKQ